MPSLTPDQLARLQSLGIAISNTPQSTSNPPANDSNIPLSLAYSQNDTPPGTLNSKLLKPSKSPLLPLFSISGLTLLSFGGLLLLKSKNDAPPSAVSDIRDLTSDQLPEPTQVPKSIQHYLLTSQQMFTRALAAQNTEPAQVPDLINQSILAATDAVKQFPDDYRGYSQRASIYQALIDSRPQFLEAAIADYSKASSLNPGSPELTRSLAGLYARKGDAQNTLTLLARTVALEPTKAQNFYDLARIQQQTGQIDGAVDTYSRLLTIVADPAQKEQVRSELSSLQKLASQAPVQADSHISPTTHPSPISLPDSPNLIQADVGPGLIIAAPDQQTSINVSGVTDSNSLSGTATLASGQTSLSFTNSLLTADSRIYLSIVSGNPNLNLQVLSRSGSTFVIGLDSPAASDLTFKWWIVNP